MHGGKTPTGLALPQTSHYRYGKAIAPRLFGQYITALKDPTLLEQAAEIALLQTRIEEQLAGMDWAESGAAWQELGEAWKEVLKWKNDDDLFRVAVADLGQIIVRGNLEHMAWQEIADLIERKRRVVESERKRNIELEQSVTQADAMRLITALLQSVKNHVEPKAFALVQADFIRHIGATGDGWPEAGEDRGARVGVGEMQG